MLNYFGFGNNSSFGLDIKDESIKYIELISENGDFKVGRFGEREIPKGVIKLGKIKDKEWLKQILLLLKKEEGIKSAHISLPYELLEKEEQDSEIDTENILESTMKEYLSVFKDSQISPLSLEFEAKAIVQSIVKRGDLETYMIVDFGKDRTGIFVISNGSIVFTYVSKFNGTELTNMIQEELEVSFAEAEKIKNEHGLKRNIPNKRLTQIFLNGFSVLSDEIKKHFINWHINKEKNKENNPTIKKIILCGSESNIGGLSEHLAITLKNDIEHANVWINILDTEKTTPEIDFNKSFIFTPALGVALNGFYKNK